jgi:hypothetical protein
VITTARVVPTPDDRVAVTYEHAGSAEPVFMGLSTRRGVEPDTWKGAFVDVIGGEQVVWARFPDDGGTVAVWLRDGAGARAVTTVTLAGASR